MPPDPLLDGMMQTARSMGDLPGAFHALAVMATGAGLVLWLAGRKLLRPAVVVLFALTGAAAGVLLIPLLPATDAASPITGAAAGLIGGALLGLLLFRFAMAAALGVVLGLAAPLITAAALDMPLAGLVDCRPHAPDLSYRGSDAAVVWDLNHINPPAHVPAEAARALAGTAVERAEQRWSGLAPERQAILAAAGAGGAMFGILLGLILPMWAAGAVSALVGPAVWLPCAIWLADSVALSGYAWLHRDATEWLTIWGALALVGLMVQWSGLLSPRRAGAGGPRYCAA